GVQPRFEVAPMPDFEPIATRLHAAGLHQSGFIELLSASPVPAPSSVDGDVAVERLPPEPSLVFAETLLGGHEVPADAHVAGWEAAARFPTLDTHTAFLARDRSTGEPMGAALLVAVDGVGYLANASTLPAQRRRGAQTALIHARLAAARDAGCVVATSLATPG